MGNREKGFFRSGEALMLASLAALICCGALLMPALIGSGGFAPLAGVFLNPVVQVTALALFTILVGIAWKRNLLLSGSGMRFWEPGKHKQRPFSDGRTARTLEWGTEIGTFA